MRNEPTGIERRICGRGTEQAREARRTIGREREYQCSECEFERRSWLALRSCPSCGSGFAQAHVVRAALG